MSYIFDISKSIIWYNRIYSLKYLRSTTLESKDIWFRKVEFVAKTQFLSLISNFLPCMHYPKLLSTQSILKMRNGFCSTLDGNSCIVKIEINSWSQALLICRFVKSIFDILHGNRNIVWKGAPIWKINSFIDPKIKSAQLAYRDQANEYTTKKFQLWSKLGKIKSMKLTFRHGLIPVLNI